MGDGVQAALPPARTARGSWMCQSSMAMQRIPSPLASSSVEQHRKCEEFCHLLHLEANGFISATLKKYKTANDDWNINKKLFLQLFDIKGTA